MTFRRYGLSIGSLHVTWRDLWAELQSPLRPAPGLGRVLVHRGFKGNPWANVR